MLFNYHTHTFRCHHASGSEREYIENAIKIGLKTLGFSDHAPFMFPNGFVSGTRMSVSEIEDYFTTVRDLAKEYEGRIKILCGLEMEYYPSLHKSEMEMLEKYAPDFLILGQHYIGEEWEGRASPRQNTDSAFNEYIEQTAEAMQTGDFLYLAHPDIIGYSFSESVMGKGYTRLCECAKEMSMPLEINLLGVRGGRHYPNARFFEIAKKVGNKIVLGIDAHAPNEILHNGEKAAMEMVNALGLELVSEEPV